MDNFNDKDHNYCNDDIIYDNGGDDDENDDDNDDDEDEMDKYGVSVCFQ
jgi:hypothetical protein